MGYKGKGLGFRVTSLGLGGGLECETFRAQPRVLGLVF